MEALFKELPDSAKVVLKDMMEICKSFRSPDTDFKEEMFQPKESKGYRFPPGFNPKTAEAYFDDEEIEENTVFLFSYPKTGTNWTLEVLRQIIYGDNEKLNALTKNIPPFLTMLEIWNPSKLELLRHLALPRKVIGSHLPAELVNFEEIKKAKAKIIILIRNPKDQAISWFHFSQQRNFDAVRDEMSSDWSQFFQDYVQGKHRTISKLGEWYPEFLLGWYKYKDEDNVMFVHFEDMKKDPEALIRKMAEFLDVKLSDDRVYAIVRDTSFDVMKKSQEKGDSEMAKLQASFNVIRKGHAGGWKNTFTVAQSEQMDKLIAEKLGKIDINFRYE